MLISQHWETCEILLCEHCTYTTDALEGHQGEKTSLAAIPVYFSLVHGGTTSSSILQWHQFTVVTCVLVVSLDYN